MPLDFVKETDELQSFALRFVLSPTQWAEFNCPAILAWHRVKFEPPNSSHVPETTGIYAFVVEHPDSQFPPHGYVMYIGITRSDGGGTLRKRFSNYIGEKRGLKRPKLHYMLNKWSSQLYFHYAEMADTECDILDLERRFCDALLPPFNQNDFSAKIRKQVRAFRD